jgi:gamma-glutamylaminecyclotransferase
VAPEHRISTVVGRTAARPYVPKGFRKDRHVGGVIRLFAFGTLKRGFALHERGLARADYLGLFKTRKPYPMLIAGRWFAPMMFDERESGPIVKGELYQIDELTLRTLDLLESVGKPENFRGLVELESVADREACVAFAYFKSRTLATLRHSDCLTTYGDARFVAPEDREKSDCMACSKDGRQR